MKIKISKEKIKEIYHNSVVAKTILQEIFGKEAFEFDPIIDIQDFSDIIRLNNMTRKDWVEKVRGLSEDEKAYITLKLIAAAYNQGWEPDWEDKDEGKYHPWFYVPDMLAGCEAARVNASSSSAAAAIGSRLAFKKREYALDAGKKFDEVYRGFLIGIF